MEFLTNMGFIINMPIWYISILLQCYIIAYIFVKIISKYKCSKWILFLPIIFTLSLEYSGLINTNFILVNMFSARGIKAFFIGIVFCIVLEKYTVLIEKYQSRLLLLAYFILGMIYLLYKMFGDGIFGNLLYVLIFIVYPIIIFIILYSNTWNKIASVKIFQILGKVSFEMYLWNLPIQLGTILVSIAFSYEFPYEKTTFLFFHMLLSMVIAGLLYYLVEIPIQKRLLSQKKEN